MTTKGFRQDELVHLSSKGRTVLFSYRALYQIRQSPAVGYYLQRLPHKLGENWTARGRFIAYTPEEADAILEKHYGISA